MLPALIRETESAGGDDREACSVRALVYDTAAALLLHRVGETSLAWTAADRALAAAEQSGRPELVALQAYRLSYVIAGRKHPAEALELAMSASAGLERVMRAPDADTLSVYGALHLAGVHAAAAVYDRAMTATLLARAREIAAHTGDGNRMGTAFGHVNVATHTLSASLQLGDAKTAIETGESLDPASLPAGCERHVSGCCSYPASAIPAADRPPSLFFSRLFRSSYASLTTDDAVSMTPVAVPAASAAIIRVTESIPNPPRP
jgi:hypothetical protein